MVTTKTENVILLSIWPIFAKAILQRDKMVEFRKIRLKAVPDFVVIYETAPTAKISGFFSVKYICEDHPKSAWEKFNSVSGIRRNDFFNYYKNSEKAVCIVINEVWKLKRPISLGRLGIKTPPQSFYYLSSSHKSKLESFFCNKNRPLAYSPQTF